MSVKEEVCYWSIAVKVKEKIYTKSTKQSFPNIFFLFFFFQNDLKYCEIKYSSDAQKRNKMILFKREMNGLNFKWKYEIFLNANSFFQN